MRNSVKAETIVATLSSGNAEAKKLLNENDNEFHGTKKNSVISGS